MSGGGDYGSRRGGRYAGNRSRGGDSYNSGGGGGSTYNQPEEVWDDDGTPNQDYGSANTISTNTWNKSAPQKEDNYDDFPKKQNDEGSNYGRGGGGRGRTYESDGDRDGGYGRGGGDRSQDNRRGGGRSMRGRRNQDDGDGGGYNRKSYGNEDGDEPADRNGRQGGYDRRRNDDGGNRRGGYDRKGYDNDDGDGSADMNGRQGGYDRRRNDDGGNRRGGYDRRRNDEDEGGSPDRGGRRGGGGRGGGDGGGRGGDGEGTDEKPRERYIPPDPTDDEDVIFGSGITSGINFSKYDNIRVKVSGENAVSPISKFEQANLREIILNNVKKSGYTTPTPIQKYALPNVMMGRDLMACAQTGSGKTAAFLIPIINTLLENPSDLVITSTSVEPQAVIVSPTRELTLQIFNEARKFALGSIIKVAVAYGGTAAYHQANILMRGCHILVATPGRLNDFVSRGKVAFSSVRFFVLDEADRMLDMGFKPEIEKMLRHDTMVPAGERQTMMFSATFPEEIQRMAQDYLHNYLFIVVGIVGGACADVQQIIHQVSRFDKKEKLKEILSQAEDNEKTLVFVEQKRTADFIAVLLSENGFPTTSIHGDRYQSQREMALNDFKTGRMPTLVATAVAARGLDIKNVGHVINFDMPSSIEEYVHRIGRTGRVGNRGRATSFFDAGQDGPLARHLITILEQANQEVPEFLLESKNEGGGGSAGVGDFGGRDVRQGSGSKSFESNNNVPCTLEDEEEW